MSNGRNQGRGNDREEFILSRTAQALLQKYDFQLEALAARILSEFKTERTLITRRVPTRSVDPASPGILSPEYARCAALIALDFETYVSVAFDLGKLVKVVEPKNGYLATDIFREIIQMRTDARHAHKYLESRGKYHIEAGNYGIRFVFHHFPKVTRTRTFQEIHTDLEEARKKFELGGQSLRALLKRLDIEKQTLEGLPRAKTGILRT